MTIHWCARAFPPAPDCGGFSRTDTRWWCGTARFQRHGRSWAISRATCAPIRSRLDGSPAAGDIAVSMLPADQHVGIAKACLAKNANFVSSSYIAPEMRALDPEFKAKGLVSVNEVGLDPGIDHLMAHDLVARYRASPVLPCRQRAELHVLLWRRAEGYQRLQYKFSWAPVGVLKALRSPSAACATSRN